MNAQDNKGGQDTVDTAARLRVLILDDEANIRRTLTLYLEGKGHTVRAVSNAQDALSEATRDVFDLLFLDLRLGEMNGLDLIPEFRRLAPWMTIVVITAYASVATAVEAMRKGALDYLPKPFDPEQVAVALHRVVQARSMEQRIAQLQHDVIQSGPDPVFSSRYPSMQKAIELARHVADSDAIVLLRGPSGTGKTLLGKAIHTWSRRCDQRLGVISCPVLSPLLLESELFGHVKGAFTGATRDNPGHIAMCEGGTLILDEIGDLPLPLQPKLLRFIQDKQYTRVGDHATLTADVRLIAATHVDLQAAIREDRFREDLYYRLNVFEIDLPPLGERPDDVESLAKEMLEFFGAQNHKVFRGFSEEALDALRAHSWPGNIRELRNVVERAAILCMTDVVGTEHLPASIVPQNRPVQLGDSVPLAVVEENHIRRVVASARSLQEAADLLAIDQATLWRKRKQYGI